MASTQIHEIAKSRKTAKTLIAMIALLMVTTGLAIAGHNCNGPLAQYSNVCQATLALQ